MDINPTNSIRTDSDTAANAANRLPVRTLTQEDFLKLLVAQMTSQDPLSPRTDMEFIAQMAQFSALEQSKSMQSDMARLRAEQQVLQANALLGRVVALQIDEDTVTTGTVSAVAVVEGTPKLVVNGMAYGLDRVTTITEAQRQP